MLKKTLLSVFFLSSFILYSQKVEISGQIFDEYLEPFPGAIIKSSDGKSVTSKFDGTFTLKDVKLPITIIVSSVGYSTEKIEVTKSNQKLSFILKENYSLDEVVVSASRSPERVFESPVSIERIGINDIKRSPSVSFYESVENLKGVDVNTNSLIFQSVNTRGFADLENVRFVQLIDGVDNVYAASNYSLGNSASLVDLDVASVEILPGAASALYGANAFNGIMLITSKNPFEYQGVSAELKSGITRQEAGGSNAFYNPSVRMAHKFNDYIAVKAMLTHYAGDEWHATDYRNTEGIGNIILDGNGRNNNPNYDGLNVYGDEYGINIKSLPYLQFLSTQDNSLVNLMRVVPNRIVTRTGYNEEDLVDNKIKNTKFNVGLNFRPFGNQKLEIIWTSRFNKGNKLFQAPPSRYGQVGASLNQHALEFKGENYFLRGYFTDSYSGETFNTRLAAIALNRRAKSDANWFREYMAAYSGLIDGVPGGIDKVARDIADSNRPKPGSEEFTSAFNEIKNIPIAKGGSGFKDRSGLYHVDGNFNFGKYIDFADIQIGGSFRRYLLNSNGNLFTDYDGEKIKIDEYGVYTQIQKKFADERLKFTGSARYDKSENFEGNFSPRASITYALGKDKNHNIRFAYQTAFRNPKTQDQYLGLVTGRNRFVMGNTTDNINRFKGTVENLLTNESTTINGEFAFTPGFTSDSYRKYYKKFTNALSDNSGLEEIVGASLSSMADLQTGQFTKELKSEKVIAFELGYRGMLNITGNRILEVDINGYYNKYKDFINYRELYIPLAGDVNAPRENDLPVDQDPFALALLSVITNNYVSFTLPTNSKADIESYGFGVSLKTKIIKNFDFGANYTWTDFTYDKKSNPNFEAGFNTPKHKVKVQFGNDNLFKNFGFNINARWQTAFYWQSELAEGMIDERTVLDAQVSYKIPYLKSRLKLGGTNLTGKEYLGALGTGPVGSVFYLSWLIND